MILLPVIERELRAAARHSFTYSLRVIGVLALLVVFAMVGLEEGLGRGIGSKLFGYLHCTLLFSIWILVPLLTADCISRERREGTLPLLFLTPLKPRDIVYAKGMAHGLRALTLWLAVVPILTVPFILGGVSWQEVAFSVLVNFSSICLAMAAGMLGSAASKSWTRAMGLGLGLSFAFLLIFMCGLALLVWAVAAGGTGGGGGARMPVGMRIGVRQMFSSGEPLLLWGYALSVNLEGSWRVMLSRLRTPWPWLELYIGTALASLLVLLLLARLAAWRVQQVWREQPPSLRVAWLKERLFTPVLFRSLLRRWLQWKLERNPIGWLEQRSWSGRLVVWSWLAVVVCVYSSLFANLSLYQRAFHSLQTFLAALLVLSIALSAAGSFRREHETGVLELLLVAPLQERQIIGGRVRGLWSQFLPAVALLLAVWLYCGAFLSTDNEFISVLLYAVSFATVPVVGLYFSLAKTNFIAALIWTLLVQVVVPNALTRMVEFWFGPYGSANNSFASSGANLIEVFIPAYAQIGIALYLGWRLQDNLKRRKFALESRKL